MENQQRYFPANFNNHFRVDFLPLLSLFLFLSFSAFFPALTVCLFGSGANDVFTLEWRTEAGQGGAWQELLLLPISNQ